MRTSLWTIVAVCLVAAGLFGSTAFNYAQLTARNTRTYIVQDDAAYLALAKAGSYDCYVGFDSSGKIYVQWDVGSSCGSGGGTGTNPNSTYYFHDVIKIVNKGTKTLTGIWVNSSNADLTIQYAAASGTMTSSGTYGQNSAITSSTVVTEDWFLGFKIDGSSRTTANSPLLYTITVDARSST